MKISSKNATLLKILGIISVASLSTVTLLYPNVLGNGQSIRSVEEKALTMETLNSELVNNESTMERDNASVQRLKESIKPLQTEADSVLEGMADTEFKYHMPSILVAVEQNANENNLELEIEYDKIQTLSDGSTGGQDDQNPENRRPGDENMGEEQRPEEEFRDEGQPMEEEYLDENASPEEEYLDESMSPEEEYRDEKQRPEDEYTDENMSPKDRQMLEQERIDDEMSDSSDMGQGGDAVEGEGLVEEPIGTTDEENNPLESDVDDTDASEESITIEGTSSADGRPELDESTVQANVPMIPGVSVKTIPLRVNGSYADIRAFILYLDEVDFVEHNIIDLYSYGDNVSTIIILNVFYTESGGGLY